MNNEKPELLLFTFLGFEPIRKIKTENDEFSEMKIYVEIETKQNKKFTFEFRYNDYDIKGSIWNKKETFKIHSVFHKNDGKKNPFFTCPVCLTNNHVSCPYFEKNEIHLEKANEFIKKNIRFWLLTNDRGIWKKMK